jgi:hypothetical protein
MGRGGWRGRDSMRQPFGILRGVGGAGQAWLAAALSGGLAAPRSPRWTSTTSTAGSAAPRQRKPWTRPSKPTSPITWPAGTFS